MGLKDSFAPEDWARVVGAPMLAGIAVTAAEPGGLWGAVRESTAVAGRVAEAGTEGGFLGFGGEKVSAAEKATLERLASALA